MLVIKKYGSPGFGEKVAPVVKVLVMNVRVSNGLPKFDFFEHGMAEVWEMGQKIRQELPIDASYTVWRVEHEFWWMLLIF